MAKKAQCFRGRGPAYTPLTAYLPQTDTETEEGRLAALVACQALSANEYNGRATHILFGWGEECSDGQGNCDNYPDMWVNAASKNSYSVEPVQLDCQDPTGYDPSAADEMYVDILITGGGYPGEITWEIKNSANTVVYSGTGNSANMINQELLRSESYTFYGYDSYGDGWNNGFVEIKYTGGGNRLIKVEMPSGSSVTKAFNLPPNPPDPNTANCYGNTYTEDYSAYVINRRKYERREPIPSPGKWNCMVIDPKYTGVDDPTVNLCDIATLLLSLSISVITHGITSPILNNFFALAFFLVQLSSLECRSVLSPGSNSQKQP